jgi:hypothetical protein
MSRNANVTAPPVESRAATMLEALTHGTSGLALAYASVEIPMLVSLIRRGAPLRKILQSPLVALPLTAAAGIGLSAAAPLTRAAGLTADSILQLALGVGVSAAVGWGGAWALARQGSASAAHRRGTVISQVPSRRALRDRASAAEHGQSPERTGEVTLAGVPVAARDETKHFKLIGTTGTGKSTAVQEMLAGALGRGDRAVIADPDYGYVRRFYDPRRGDVILNPFDSAGLKWDLFGEITETYDIDQLARSLIPDQGGTDKSWREYARTFFTAVTQQARAGGETQIEELNRLLLVADPEELRTLVQGTPAQSFLRESNARMFDSIRSVTSSAVGALEHVARQKAQLFSVRKWVQQEKRGVLFMPYRAGQIAALRSSISAWMRLAIFEAMNQPEGDQRLWFVVDELDALGQIDGLKDALARLRKFGGRCVLGFQSVAQVSSTYGAGEAQTIVENCGNTLILRCAASEHGGTSHFASRLIGQREVVRTTVSHSRRPLQWLPSITRAEHSSIEPAVLDSEIEQLPDLNGYLKFASVPHWYRVRLTPEASTVLNHGRDGSGSARSAATGTRAEERQTGGHVGSHVSGGGNVRD